MISHWEIELLSSPLWLKKFKVRIMVNSINDSRLHSSTRDRILQRMVTWLAWGWIWECCKAILRFLGFCTNVFSMSFECKFFIYNNVHNFLFFNIFHHWAIYCDLHFEVFSSLFSNRMASFLYVDVYPLFLTPLHILLNLGPSFSSCFMLSLMPHNKLPLSVYLDSFGVCFER